MSQPGAWRLASVVTLVIGLACAPGEDLQTDLTSAENLNVLRYLDCIDCVIPLDSVRALATRKPDATVDSLNRGLLMGPGVQAVVAAESVLVIGYLRDSVWRAQQGLLPLPQRMVYVEQARDRFVNGYRSRGAYGLGWIHTPRAVAHLDSALAMPLPPSVMRAVKFARDSLPPPQ